MGLSIISSLPKGINAATLTQNGVATDGLPKEFATLLSEELVGLKGLIPDSIGKTPNLLNTPIGTPTALLAQFPTRGFVDTQVGSEIALEQKLAVEEVPGENGSLINPALLAPLTSNLALQPEFPVFGTAGFKAATEQLEKQTLAADEAVGENRDPLDPALLASETGHYSLQMEIPLRGSLGFQAGTDSHEKRITELNRGTSGTDTSLTGPSERNQKAVDGLGIFEKFTIAAPRSGQYGIVGNEAANFAAETNPLDTNDVAQPNAIGATPATGQSRQAPAVDQSNIHTHLRESTWSQQFGEKIVWLARSDQQSAQININPPELGPVQITLNLNGDQAKLAFASPHPEVRQAIESALPQLKEMLSSAGINLGQTNIGANLAQQNTDNPHQAANGRRSTDENAILPANEKALSTNTSSVLQRGRGLVDLFA